MQSKCKLRLLTRTLAIAIVMGCIPSTGCSRKAEQKIPEVRSQGQLNSEACQMSAKPAVLVTIPEFISDPARYDGQHIVLEGFYYSGFELSAISSRRQGPKELILDDALWVTGISPFAEINGQRVQISGIASATQKGHLSLWPASICASEVRLLPDATG